MKLLVVEDEDPKRRHILNFLSQCLPRTMPRIAKSYNAAIDELEKDVPDLLLVDMSLPTFDIRPEDGGGRPQGFGGLEILRHMKLSGQVCPFVVITGYDAFPKGKRQLGVNELREELRRDFPTCFIDLLAYSSVDEEWKVRLSTILTQFENA